MKPYRLPREQWSKAFNHELVKMVFIGCPHDRKRLVFKRRMLNGRSVYTVAHAHYKLGMICIRSKRHMTKYIAIHELAHLITYNDNPNYKGHGKQWKDCVKNLGGTLKRCRYQNDYRWAKK